MARIRTVKPSFFTSESVASIPDYAARLTFIGLWTYCDDSGRGADNTRLIKAALWPLDDDMTPEMIDAHLVMLTQRGHIRRYQVDGRRYLVITGWKHQKINRPQESTLPEPPLSDATTTTDQDEYAPGGTLTERSLNDHGTISEPAVTVHPRAGARAPEEVEVEVEGNGREGIEPSRHRSPNEPTTVAAPRSPPATNSDADLTFAQFWEGWPPRGGKKCLKADALTAWRRMKPAERELALAAEPNYAQACRNGTQGCQDAVRWLRGRRWFEFETPPDPATNGHRPAHGERSVNAITNMLNRHADPPPHPPDPPRPPLELAP